ncbi:hypothetical protein PM082_019655 [Marasmius tenuissimus]|nr:hypothetical protein PM082_019655 [Marasmius tenuissimus]
MDLSKPDRVITTIRRPHADLVTSDLPGQVHPARDEVPVKVSLCLDTLVDTVLHVVALPMINGWKPRQYFDRIIHTSDCIRDVDVVAGQADEGVVALLRRHVIAIDPQSFREEDWAHTKPAPGTAPSPFGLIARSITS